MRSRRKDSGTVGPRPARGCDATGVEIGARLGHCELNAATLLDREAIAHACERYGVARLRVFGSAVTGRFDPNRSDVDFFVDFLRG